MATTIAIVMANEQLMIGQLPSLNGELTVHCLFTPTIHLPMLVNGELSVHYNG